MSAFIPGSKDLKPFEIHTPSGPHASRSTSEACRICGSNGASRTVEAREHMYGTSESFRYVQCLGCGVLYLASPPADMARFYPADSYYSVRGMRGALRRWAMEARDKSYVGESLLGRLLAKRFPNSAIASTVALAKGRKSRILDVGCGSGDLLKSMARLGYVNLVGVDPLLQGSTLSDGVQLHGGEIADVPGQFDLVCFHHSLEHIADQVGVLQQAASKLAPDGSVLVRVPTSECLAFTLFGEHWFQIDAPRHLYLHSQKSLEIVANAAGLEAVSFSRDSQPMQFWASQLYADGHSLVSPQAKAYAARYSTRFYRRLSAWLNEQGQGDQMVVRLRPLWA
ncbi:class I SAM-dependent methyltransferase [Piscinibacter sp. HJYY11]|uniref:class I SAM-dependent methyltransferase n=1 Tax=Piscinibacter sp. HJYY11 TaxID=2801333 RepID=UPI00191EA880|nr:class I SAM-dependent methyltransferase [Piscinibacter sp. HJYY11]MBL0727919.1 class I SAM-dependent methyltransferase [Piscinibacter sp. HJYY11]